MRDFTKMNYKRQEGVKKRSRIPGRKLEYPIPPSTDYWQKLCDDEAKKLIIVRNPFLDLSYRFYSKNNPNLDDTDSCSNDKLFNCNFLPKFYTDDRTTLENSLHKQSLAGWKSELKNDHSNDGKSLLVPILAGTSSGASKVSHANTNLAATVKILRTQKLDSPGAQPSSSKIFLGKVDPIRVPFSGQNKPKVRCRSSSTLPILGPFSKPLDSELTSSKMRKYLRLPEQKDPEIDYQRRGRAAEITNEKSLHEADQILGENNGKLTREEYLKYSARVAHRALKRVTKNKNPNFRIQLEPRKKSSVHVDGQRNLLNVENTREHEEEEEEDAKFMDEVQKVPEKKFSMVSELRFDNRQLQKFEEPESKTISTTSRSTSGSSPRYLYPKNWDDPSNCILKALPKLSGYPRRHCDRCLPCMYKPFEAPQERNISLPRTLLQRIMAPLNGKNLSENSTSSTSSSILSFEDELVKSANYILETEDAGFSEEFDALESQVISEPFSILQKKFEQEVKEVKQDIPDSKAPRKTITKEVKRDEREDNLISKNLEDPAVASTKVPSFEGMRVSHSLQSESSEEDDSNIVSMSNVQSKPKFFVPCHAPTVFRPSLEPLRALRNRKSTSLQDRIAMLESTSLKKSTSVENFDDVPEKPRSKEIINEDKTSDKKKLIPGPLMKAKSYLGQVAIEKPEVDAGDQQRVLKRGSSLPILSASTDTVTKEFKKYSEIAQDTFKKSDSPSRTVVDKNVIETQKQLKLPLTDPKEIVEILKDLDENTSSIDILDILCKEFSKRLLNDTKYNDSNMKDRNETITTLTRLLVDSKRYLYPDKFPSNLSFSTNQPPACNPEFLRRILPLNTYNAIAPLLDMPEWYPKKQSVRHAKDFDHDQLSLSFERTSLTFDSLEVHPPTSRDTESPGEEGKVGHRRYNPYGLFLTRPRRKVVTWRPLTKRDLEGYDPDATLETRAENMMKRICQDFCKWVDSLGGTDKTIDEEVLRDMFEIDFSAEACRAMQILIQEMPVVPAEVAITRNCPESDKLTMTTKHVMRDAKAEETSPRIVGFGTALPRELRFIPPKNRVHQRWLECENVQEDLETMDMVWKDITHLRSVRGFVEWLQQHPEVPPPEALKKIASMDIRALRQIEDDETFAHLELDIDQIQSLRVAVNGNGQL